jgi:glycosyltransferase involved in cell wall biosynthesis
MLTNAKILMTLHDSPSKEYAMKKGGKEKFFFYYYKFIYFFLRRYVDEFIVHSKNGENINVKEWGIKRSKIITLPIGLPVEIKKLNKDICKKKLGYSNKKILLILGYIRGSKNYGIVLESLKNLKKDVILLIAGTIQQQKDRIVYENILKKIKQLGLENRVKLLGFAKEEEMPLLLNAADIGIDLRSQGSGDFLSSTMAMELAYNIPILATSIPSFENLKKEEGCIETFNENPTDLTKKIDNLLYNNSKIKSLKIKAYWEKNNWNEIGKRTKNLYLSLFK